MKDQEGEKESLHFYLIKYGIIPHFDLLNNPAICCSPDGGIICDANYENSQNFTKEKTLLRSHSTYFKDIILPTNSSQLNISENFNFETEGTYYLLFLVCSPLKVQEETYSSIKLTGYISFFNSFGYLSADEFYTVDIYLFLSLFYFITGLYWVYRLIVNNNGLNFYTKTITILLPIVILEKMMRLQIFSELNKIGELNSAFEWIFLICNLAKNILLRVFFFAIALGYKFNVVNYQQISKKKIFNYSWIMLWYCISLIVYLIIDSKYTFK